MYRKQRQVTTIGGGGNAKVEKFPERPGPVPVWYGTEDALKTVPEDAAEQRPCPR